MRLSPAEQHAIVGAVKSLDSKAKTYLYGSRTDDSLRGGDIDLLVLSESLAFADKLTLLVLLKEKLGEQRIDLSILTQEAAQSDPFFGSVLSSALLL